MRHVVPVLRAALAVLALFASPAAASVVASSAADLCDASVDPCVVSQPVEAVGTLDFALRTLRVEGAGVIEVAGTAAEIACGRLEIQTPGAAVRVRSGVVSLLVRRACSLRAIPCLTDADCAQGDAGACRGGDGSASIDGSVVADAETPGRVLVRAAGDVAIRRPVTARGTRTESDGGTVEIESTTGSVLVDSAVDVSGGGLAAGGDAEILAAEDVVVQAPLRSTGGEYDGGSIWLAAARDALVLDDVSAGATAGAGFGGSVVVEAGRDAVFDGGTATNSVTIGVDGHQSLENYGGDGGTIDVEAGRDVVATRYVRFEASGAAPDGFGDTLSFAADGALRFGATVVAKGRGIEGGGAIVDLASEGAMQVASGASFELGGPAVAGDLTLESGGALEFAGEVDVTSSASGVAGRVVAVAAGDAEVAGRWTTSGGASAFSVGELYLEACRASVTGSLENAAEAGRTTIVAREIATVAANASVVSSGAGATNAIVHRDAASPPVVEGIVRPAPSIVVDEALAPCTGCTSSPDGCVDVALCREICSDTGCSPAVLIAPSLVLRSGRDGTSGVWKGEIVAPDVPLSEADVRIVAAAADSGFVFDEVLPAGSLRAAGSGWRLRSDRASRVRKAVFRPGSTGGLLRARVKLAAAAGAVVADAGIALALAVSDAAAADSDAAVTLRPCADSGLLDCETTRRRTVCTAAP